MSVAFFVSVLSCFGGVMPSERPVPKTPALAIEIVRDRTRLPKDVISLFVTENGGLADNRRILEEGGDDPVIRRIIATHREKETKRCHIALRVEKESETTLKTLRKVLDRLAAARGDTMITIYVLVGLPEIK